VPTQQGCHPAFNSRIAPRLASLSLVLRVQRLPVAVDDIWTLHMVPRHMTSARLQNARLPWRRSSGRAFREWHIDDVVRFPPPLGWLLVDFQHHGRAFSLPPLSLTIRHTPSPPCLPPRLPASLLLPTTPPATPFHTHTHCLPPLYRLACTFLARLRHHHTFHTCPLPAATLPTSCWIPSGHAWQASRWLGGRAGRFAAGRQNLAGDKRAA